MGIIYLSVFVSDWWASLTINVNAVYLVDSPS